MAAKGEITLKRQPISMLARMMSGPLQAQVIDETGIEGNYDFDLPYVARDPTVLITALEELGFRLEKTMRPAQVLVVESVATTSGGESPPHPHSSKPLEK